MRSKNMRFIENAALAALAALLAHPRSAPCAVTVTASREYVVKQTTLHPVTNNGEVVGYALGTQTGKILPSKEYVDDVSSKDGYVTTNDLNVAVTNLEDKIEKATPDNYEAVSSAALSAVQPEDLDVVVSNLEEQISVASSAVSSNDVKLSEVKLPYGKWTVTPSPSDFYLFEYSYDGEWIYQIVFTNGSHGTQNYNVLTTETRQIRGFTFSWEGTTYAATPSGPSVYMLGDQRDRLLQPAGVYTEKSDFDSLLASVDLQQESIQRIDDALSLKQDALPYPTNAIPYSVISGAPEPSPSVETKTNRYPLFVIDLNPDKTRFWNHIELKATTNNYRTAHQNMLFFMGTTTNGTNTDDTVFIHDWCRLFILSRRVSSDVRKWIRIRNTGDLNGYAPLALAIIVDPSMFRRNQGSEWLYEGNEELVWSYVRIGLQDVETDQDGVQCWRPVMPVKWFAEGELPAWANEPAVTPDSSDVAEYVPPWNTAIENADTSYRWFGGVTNVNQSVQYVLSAPGNVLSIQIPSGGDATKDWVVYGYFGAETQLHLPSGSIWWMADEKYTNSIPANTPTAFYFSQVTNGVFTLSRQELKKVTIQ